MCQSAIMRDLFGVETKEIIAVCVNINSCRSSCVKTIECPRDGHIYHDESGDFWQEEDDTIACIGERMNFKEIK